MTVRAPFDLRLAALAGAAGCLDATSFLGLDEIFPANQTGNTALLGIALGRGDWTGALHSAASLLAFCGGVLVLALLLRDRPARGWTRAITVALWGEVALLLALLALWDVVPLAAAIVLAAAAMGVQSLAAQRVGVPGVSTTFVTGTLTRLSSRLAGGEATVRDDGTPALVWVAYLVGAVAGGALSELVDGRAGVGAVVLVVAVVAARPPRRILDA